MPLAVQRLERITDYWVTAADDTGTGNPCLFRFAGAVKGQFGEIEPMIDDQYGVRCEDRVGKQVE